MDRSTLRLVWRKRLDDLERSELSVRRWCDRNGVRRGQVNYWRRYFEMHTEAICESDCGWLSVGILDTDQTLHRSGIPSSCNPLRISIGSISIHIDQGFDPSLLRAVVAALEQRAC